MNSGVSAAIAVSMEVDFSSDKAADVDAEGVDAEDDGLLQRFGRANNE